MREVRKTLIEIGGKYLILKRADNGKRYQGCWDLPGGKVESGEEPMGALRREVKEETGLELLVEEELLRFKLIKDDVLMIIFAGSVKEDQDIVLSREHADYEMMSLNRLCALNPVNCEINLKRYIMSLC